MIRGLRGVLAAVLCLSPMVVARQAAAPAAASVVQAACTAPTTIPNAGGAPWPAGQVLAANSLTTVHTATGSNIAWLPRAFGADVVTRDAATGVDRQDKQITMVYTANIDVGSPPGGVRNGVMVSANSGASFAPAPDITGTPLAEVGNLLDGRLLAMTFIVNGELVFNGNEVTIPLILNVSADKGRTWDRLTAQAKFTDSALPGNLPWRSVSAIKGVRASGRPIQMTNGTVVMPIYFNMANGSGGFVGFESVFTAAPGFVNGAVDTASPWNFTMHSVTSNPTLSFGESAVVERQDGALLMVTRGNVPDAQLSYKVSTTSGATWSGINNVSFADQPGCAVYGVSPQLALMPNGLLVLSSGRPNNWIAISTDATGTSWTREQTTYSNRPDQTWWYGSSGYTSLVPTASNQLLQFVDNCAAPNGVNGKNGCVSGTGYDHDKAYRLLHRQISTLTPDLGKIDLATKLRKGSVRLTTDLTGVPPAAAVTPPTPYGTPPSAADATSTGYWSAASGAVDGSTAFWSGALSGRADGTGTYQLELDRTYRLTKLGLALLPGARAGARVSTSLDGVTWTPATLGYPVGVPAGEPGRIDTPGDRALRYYTLGVDARYVRVTTDAASCAAVGGPTSCSMVNELELYSTVNSFENEPSVPHGLGVVTCVRITQPAGNGDPDHDSRYALRLKDQQDASYCNGKGTIGKFVYPGPGVSLAPAASRTLRADIYQISNTNGILFDIQGVRSSDKASIAAYHLAINSGGRWMAYDDVAKTWTGIGGAAVPLRAWTTFKVVASTGSATLYTVDAAGQETLIGPVPKAVPVAFDSITGYVASSGSTDGYGDEAIFDDISFD